MKCRHCRAQLKHVFLDLGFAPPSNAYLDAAQLHEPEMYFPLRLFVCDECWLVQTQDFAQASDLFTDQYAYFSSVSQTWLDHAERFSSMIVGRLGLSNESHVIEVGANDGYLLRNFVRRGIPCLGIEPTANTAATAERLGIPVLREFFGSAVGRRLAEQRRQADLIVCNNVYAHVPDVNDFTEGLRLALKPAGAITIEFPHLLQLIKNVQFDTVYHEHYSYFSLHTASTIFARCGLRIWSVEELPTHGGSLRVYGCHDDNDREADPSVARLLELEASYGMRGLALYEQFQAKANVAKNAVVEFLIAESRAGKRVAAYGAAAKGNTLLNYAGIKGDLLPYVCDSAVSKQGKYLPGSHIPIVAPSALRERKPDVVLILPWNISGEVVTAHRYVREWGGQFAVAIPALRIGVE